VGVKNCDRWREVARSNQSRGHGRVNATEHHIGGCLISDERVGIPILRQFSKRFGMC
jgi:hypothetical protein